MHSQFRRARYTAQETYLVSFLEMSEVVEYDKEIHEIWTYGIHTPQTAIRLRARRESSH